MLVTDSGRVIRIRVRDIPTRGRNTQGVRLIRLELTSGERVVAVEAFSDLSDPDDVEANVEAGSESAVSTVEILDDEPEGDLDDDGDGDADGDGDEEDAG
jgi:DNA gyrase subunit A